MPFSKLVAQGGTEAVDVELEEKATDALILQGATAEAEKRGIREGGDISELFGDSEGEAEPSVELRVTRKTRVTVVDSSESDPKSNLELNFRSLIRR